MFDGAQAPRSPRLHGQEDMQGPPDTGAVNAGEFQPAFFVRSIESVEKLSPKQLTDDLFGKQEFSPDTFPRAGGFYQSTTGDNAVQVRMKLELPGPRM